MIGCILPECKRRADPTTGRCDRHAVYVPRVKVKPELETPIKKRCHAAVLASGCTGWIHDADYRNGKTGLVRGCSDTIYVVPPFGVFLAIEIKRPGYSPSDVRPEQRAFLAAVRHFGGVSGIATCVAEALALVAEARQPRQSAHAVDRP